ncbi:MAG: prepilin peptidase [Acidobacteriota bacterium]|jgi:leader peptidase (prepilin peptidase)/N-methyltransferase
MDLFPYFWAAFGLVIGSFLNVCIYRLPRHQSVVVPGSHCPHCGKSVRPYDNVPVLSYLWLRGKCRFCRQPISFQYPLVESLAGLSFYACASVWSITPPAFMNSLFLALILVLILTDYNNQILPNALTLPGMIAGIALSPLQSSDFFRDSLSYNLSSLVSAPHAEIVLPWAGSLMGALVGGGLLFLVAALYQILRKRQGLGMGDVKMMAMVGAFLGWRLALLTIFLGSLLGSIVGLILVLFGGRTLQSKLAFGTFLGAAAAVSLFFGLAIIQWYTGS